MPHQVFLSYPSTDVAVANRLCATLESAGMPCWIAPRDIPPGVHYPTAIIDAVAGAHVLVLVLSDAALVSPHVATEVEEAFNRKIPIVPFRLTAAPLSKDLDYFLSLSQWLDAQDGPTDQNLSRLIAAVRAAIDGAPAPVTPQPPTPRRPWPAILVVAALVLAASGVAYWGWPAPRPKPVPSFTPSRVPPVARPVPKTPAQERVLAKTVAGQQYRWIPPGTFTMGCGSCAEDEKPVHTVALPRGFWMAATEAHAAGLLPRLGMSWRQALASCAKIGGRLPTEAEWEYAARGGQDGPAYGQLDDIAWYLENSGGEVHPVRRKQPNKYGLYDMLGNAAEWVLDRYYNQYDLAAPAIGPNIERPLRGNAMATLRGGFWETPAAELRVTRRAPRPPDEPEGMIGFRCVLDP